MSVPNWPLSYKSLNSSSVNAAEALVLFPFPFSLFFFLWTEVPCVFVQIDCLL